MIRLFAKLWCRLTHAEVIKIWPRGETGWRLHCDRCDGPFRGPGSWSAVYGNVGGGYA